MVVVERFKSAPEVPTVPSIQKVPEESTTRNHVAVPEALAEESCVIALAVNTPPEAPGKLGSLKVSSANSVVAAPPAAGFVPA